MRPKTALEVQSDVYDLVFISPLKKAVSGMLFHRGQRERDRKDYEDIVVIHTAGLPDQKQTGVVTINVYVPDHDPTGSGQMVENIDRTKELSVIAADWVDSLNTYKHSYTFELYEEIGSTPDQDTESHFVVVKLEYTIFNI